MFIVKVIRLYDEIDKKVLSPIWYSWFVSISITSNQYAKNVEDLSVTAAGNKMVFTGVYAMPLIDSTSMPKTFVEHVYLNRFVLNKRRIIKNSCHCPY